MPPRTRLEMSRSLRVIPVLSYGGAGLSYELLFSFMFLREPCEACTGTPRVTRTRDSCDLGALAELLIKSCVMMYEVCTCGAPPLCLTLRPMEALQPLK